MGAIRAAGAIMAIASAASGCAGVDDAWRGPNRQVVVLDGHVLWLDYACDDGRRLQVRYLGEWVNVRTDDGRFWRLARADAGWAGQGYSLGGGVAPTWTTAAGQTACRRAT